MSRTTTIEYEDTWYWVFDEARAIWLKYLIEAVERRIPSGLETRFAATLDDWRINAIFGDFGVCLGPWTTSERSDFLDVNREAYAALAASEPLALTEVAKWTLLDDEPLVQRLALWDDPIDLRPILELGRAVGDLVNGTLEAPAVGTKWFFGTKGGRRTIAMGRDQE